MRSFERGTFHVTPSQRQCPLLSSLYLEAVELMISSLLTSFVLVRHTSRTLLICIDGVGR